MNNDTQAMFWSRVFMRIFKTRYFSPTLQAELPSIAAKMEKRFHDVSKAIDASMRNEDSAFEFFQSEFSRLNPHEQKAVSGKYRQEWLDYDRELRGIL